MKAHIVGSFVILGDYRDINLRKGWAKSIAIATRQKSHGEMEFHLPGNGTSTAAPIVQNPWA